MSEEEDWRLNDLDGEKEEKVWALRGVGGPEHQGTPGASSPNTVLSEQGGRDSISHRVRTERVHVCLYECVRVRRTKKAGDSRTWVGHGTREQEREKEVK